MSMPGPSPGLVVRYDYLWSREAAVGRTQGKDRPACLVAATDSATTPRFVVLLPITHAPPLGDTLAIEIPARVRQAIGLDEEPCWVVVSEYNVDEWPNAGLSPVPGGRGQYAYGFVPPGLFAHIKARFLELAREKKPRGAPLMQRDALGLGIICVADIREGARTADRPHSA